MANIVAFALIVVGVSLAIGIIASILRTVLGLLFLGWLDHLLGAVLGLVQMAMLMAVIIFVATLFPVPNLSDGIRKSSLAPFVAQPFSFLLNWLPPRWNRAVPASAVKRFTFYASQNFVQAVGFDEVDGDALGAGGGDVLADVVSTDGQFAVAPVDQDGELEMRAGRPRCMSASMAARAVRPV